MAARLIDRVACALRGHQWENRVSVGERIHLPVLYCSRCGAHPR
ncbi:MAG TPA: hypothetical protein VFP54_05230 [Acidimicrobiales bacterium]|nr:hypothetical protein [Acidimicrobiales bacterium]